MRKKKRVERERPRCKERVGKGEGRGKGRGDRRGCMGMRREGRACKVEENAQ